MKSWLLVVVCFLLKSAILAESVAISIVEQKDYEILDKFFRTQIFEEEYGYVLEGLKPISIRNFLPLEEIHPYKDIQYAKKEFTHSILVGKAINIWNKLCSNQKHFALKAVPLTASHTTGWEVQFINIEKLNEVIEKNIDLFRYVLGPKIQTEELVNQIAYSNKDFDSLLHHDLVLTGIVLGFGTHNSVIGGRSETISARTISKDCAPFLPKSQLMLSDKEHNMNVFTPEAFGTYYLEFAGGDDALFKEDFQPLLPSANFMTIEEEVMAIDAMTEPYPPELLQRPGFVFNAYQGGPSNKPFLDQLKQAQKRIQALLKSPDFLEIVLEKIGGKKPIIHCTKVTSSRKIEPDLDAQLGAQIIFKVANRFEDEEQRLAFFESYCHITQAAQTPPVMAGASKALLVGLKMALSNLDLANRYFQQLSCAQEGFLNFDASETKQNRSEAVRPMKEISEGNFSEEEDRFGKVAARQNFNKSTARSITEDEALKSIISNRLYFKTTLESEGKKLNGAAHVRVGYIVEDLEGNILFANRDIWLDLSQTIAGFAHGLQEMRVGEKRTLYIHPAYGYGALTTLPPCSGLIIKVHLLAFDEKMDRLLPPLAPLDMTWIQDPSFLADIESSLKQQPRYLAFLYKTLLDHIEGLDQSEVIAEFEGVRASSA